jgi:hypothetical protein
VSRFDLGLLDDMHRDSQRLTERTLLQRDMLRKFIAKVLGRGIKAGQGTINRRGCRKAHVGAEIVVARQTRWAASAGRSWLQGYTISYFQGPYCAADLDNCASGFMPEYHGIFQDEGPNCALRPVVYIATANSGVVDCDEDIVGGLDGRFGLFFEFNVEGLVEDEGEVLGNLC